MRCKCACPCLACQATWSLRLSLGLTHVASLHTVQASHSGCARGAGKCLGTRDGLVLDAPQLRMHWPKLVLAALFQIPYVVLMVALGLPVSALTPCDF